MHLLACSGQKKHNYKNHQWIATHITKLMNTLMIQSHVIKLKRRICQKYDVCSSRREEETSDRQSFTATVIKAEHLLWSGQAFAQFP